LRSLLFIPADSERKLAKGLESGADCLILDLEDSVSLDAKARARQIAAEFLRSVRGGASCQFYVRINALDSGLADEDLAAIMPARPDGIMLPKAEGREQAERLSRMLDDHEEADGRGQTRILPLITETAASVLAAASWNRPLPRLAGITWGAEDLSADLGVASTRDGQGELTDAFRLARTVTVLAAAACRTAAIDTVHVDFRDEASLRRQCALAARDGFTGKLAIHPAQVPVLNEAFSVDAQAIAEAEAVVAAFRRAGNPGVVAIEGRMYDRPHLARAERILARAAQQSGRGASAPGK